ncbi:MAG: DUF177 domain-containing protein [Acidimicrobiales bacterium]|nr:DUF177 domain-containing protein [Acidimicrobiales bacterium]
MSDDLRVPLVVLRRRADPWLIRRTVKLDDLRVGEVVVADGMVKVDLEAEARNHDVVVSGQVQAKWSGSCRRCLEDVHGSLDLRIYEVLSARTEDSDTDSRRSGVELSGESGDVYPLGGDEADLEPVVRDTVLLSLPLSSLCAADCIGPDPERFPATSVSVENSLERAMPPTDPRWSALDALRLPDEPIH